MKNYTKNLFVAGILASTLFSSCEKENNTPTPDDGINGTELANFLNANNPISVESESATGWAKPSWAVDADYSGTDVDITNAETLTGNITSDLTLSANSVHFLKGGVHVKAGVTLTIEEGVKIVDPDEAGVSYLMIEQDAKIIAQGTAQNMIVFTTENASSIGAPGSWGGIIINGHAPINNGDESGRAVPEVAGDGIWYGGNQPTDNSGILEYVRLEFGGNQITADKEHNGFTFNGVGSGTIVRNLQAHKGADDGFEWFGGTVNAENLVSTDNGDDSFDWTEGWVGTATNLYGENVTQGDRGLEGDNNQANNAMEPFSFPTLKNITLINQGASNSQGLKLREGTKVKIENIVVQGYPTGVSIEHDITLTHVHASYFPENGKEAENSFIISDIKVLESTTPIEYKESR
ncbi:hypothetical protein EI427_19935 [Flammeovirga pectinis]|uniref:T9SS C-terminal target domain-containing protein n=1 Tax=Flammeovirga pectinis TaxID=2494373 RepID=A0A3Q9FNS7_9BACT|nr:hypothetical protein [Flammeovirga pectinis]AZQ64398.1 hypothetical protein EI427_19935 [Flammeovirga pectinis]